MILGRRQRQIVDALADADGALAREVLARRIGGSRRQLQKSLALLEEVGAVQVARSRERAQPSDLVMLAQPTARRVVDVQAVAATG